jgi:Phage portal protein
MKGAYHVSRRRRRPTQPAQPHALPQVVGNDVRQVIREELSKALQLPAGTSTHQVTTSYLQALQARGRSPVTGDASLTRDPNNDVNFGPGEPLAPSPLDPPMASGRAAPRRWDYPVTWNLQTTTTRATPWSVLRDAADQVSIMRACIEVNKAALTGLEWSFGINSTRARHLAQREGSSERAVAADLQEKYGDDIERLHNWWAKPDRINNWTFSEWLGALMEDQLVLDAVALYPHLQLNGDLHSLELLDSTTIKPLQDNRGATPQPPYAAYQQILWGFPRGEYSQSASEDVDHEFVSAVYGRTSGIDSTADSLIYKVRNRRTRGPYGFSNVEQALADIDLWLKRFDWLRSEYTAGVTPEMIVNVDTTMTPEQLRQYEAVFNDDLSGRTAERHRARFLPAGFTADYPHGHDSKFTSDFDLHLVRLICAAFEVLPTSLGFTPNHGMGGMGGSGHQQGEQDSQLRRGTKPTAQWITDLINEVSTNFLGMPPEVTFRFLGIDDEDEERDAKLLTGYIGSGLQTLNEGRDALNLPRYEFPEANQPFLNTPTGPAFLNVEVQPIGVPGNLPGQQIQNPHPTGPSAVNTSTAGEGEAGAPKPAPKRIASATAPSPASSNTRAVERKKFLTFAAKRGTTSRDFEFTHHPADFAEAANRLAAAGDIDACKALFDLHDDA